MCHCSAAAFDKYTFYANRHLSEQLSSQLSELNCSTVAKLAAAAAAEENRPAVFNSTLFCNHFFLPGLLDIRHQQQQKGTGGAKGAPIPTVQYIISVDSYPSVSQFYFRKGIFFTFSLCFSWCHLVKSIWSSRNSSSLKKQRDRVDVLNQR